MYIANHEEPLEGLFSLKIMLSHDDVVIDCCLQGLGTRVFPPEPHAALKAVSSLKSSVVTDPSQQSHRVRPKVHCRPP